jgi:hypothetical protein
MIATQFIRTPAGWKMSAMAWDDSGPTSRYRRRSTQPKAHRRHNTPRFDTLMPIHFIGATIAWKLQARSSLGVCPLKY